MLPRVTIGHLFVRFLFRVLRPFALGGEFAAKVGIKYDSIVGRRHSASNTAFDSKGDRMIQKESKAHGLRENLMGFANIPLVLAVIASAIVDRMLHPIETYRDYKHSDS